MERQELLVERGGLKFSPPSGLGLNSNVGISMVLRWQDTQRQRLHDAGQGDEIAWFGRRNGSAAIDLRLIDAFPEGLEVLGGWAEPWPWHGRWRAAAAARQ